MIEPKRLVRNVETPLDEEFHHRYGHPKPIELAGDSTRPLLSDVVNDVNPAVPPFIQRNDPICERSDDFHERPEPHVRVTLVCHHWRVNV